MAGATAGYPKGVFSEGPVLTGYQKREALNLTDNTGHNEHLLLGQKCVLRDTLPVPVLSGPMKS